ncbi:1,4-dihydroxy-2-naphthoate octaprenyltransferase [Amphritea atlantica]|uniref:1,4-dihydroxy-2-naphthoate octaprenyltransferase n=1 Tax=Amphritea atlantica TaxID=355243 RepID=A0A1H9HEE1_9GAMM|nr:prenyltransferase [Amphritea atlantica]SEQ60701.1 1,4-dihydroxy-2-naphthoate octaprenyltransferase [Amphritea atlantica]
MQQDKYSLGRALRPFSFSVALITCLVGIVSASQQPGFSYSAAVLIILAALLLQAGVNLINDHADLQRLSSTLARGRVVRNFRLGLVCFLLAAVIGIYLISYAGLGLLLLLLVGLAGALGYTVEPVNFKRRGLAVILVFWLMGVLMVCGSYYILAGEVNWPLFWRSIPVSLISSLLLLANEIRDVDSDRAAGINTLTVRIGITRARTLYLLLLLSVVLVTSLLWITGVIGGIWWLASVPLIWLLYKQQQEVQGRASLPPASGRFFMLFGLLYCLSL